MNQPLRVRRVVTGGAARVNCYVAAAESGVACVIDPGGDPDAVGEVVEELGARVAAILLTHAHYDHVGAAAELRRRLAAPLWLHAGDRRLLRQANFYRGLFHGAAPVEVPEVDHLLEDGAELPVDGMGLRVLHTPGHSPGSVCFHGAGDLFTGDTLLPGRVGRTDFPGASRDALAASLRALAALPGATRVWPGHGEPTTLEAEMESNAALREVLG